MKDFSELKVGDLVLMICWNSNNRIEKVTRTGNTFLEVNNQKYSFDGSKKPYLGSNWRISRLATQEDINRVKLNDLQRQLSYFYSQLTFDSLSENIVKKLNEIKIEIEKSKGENK
jgi:hypothetical protein